MEADDPVGDEDDLDEIVGGAVMALIFLVGFGLMFAGVPWFWVVFPVGFAGVLPAAVALARRYERTDSDPEEPRSEQKEALEQLRYRYARGELTDAEFEQRVERLLETESVDDAETFLGDELEESEAVTPADLDRSRDPETE